MRVQRLVACTEKAPWLSRQGGATLLRARSAPDTIMQWKSNGGSNLKEQVGNRSNKLMNDSDLLSQGTF
jgi:hypothetical protein